MAVRVCDFINSFKDRGEDRKAGCQITVISLPEPGATDKVPT